MTFLLFLLRHLTSGALALSSDKMWIYLRNWRVILTPFGDTRLLMEISPIFTLLRALFWSSLTPTKKTPGSLVHYVYHLNANCLVLGAARWCSG